MSETTTIVFQTEASGPCRLSYIGDAEGATSALAFIRSNLSHRHSVSGPTLSWSGGTLTAAQPAHLDFLSILAIKKTDGTGTGSVAFTYAMANAPSLLDFLTPGPARRATCDVTVTDQNGVASAQPVTFTLCPPISGQQEAWRSA